MRLNPHNIDYHLSDIDNWLSILNRSIPSELANDKLILRAEFGSGFIQKRELEQGLSICFFDLELREPVILNRIEIEENSHCLMHFHYNNSRIDAIINNKPAVFDQEYQTTHFSSSSVPANYVVPSHQHIKLLHIWMTRNWILNYLDSNNSKLSIDLLLNKPIAFVDAVSYQLNGISNVEPTTPKGILLAKLYQAMNYVFERFEKSDSNVTNIRSSDLNSILLSKKIIEDRIPKAYTVKELAQQLNMSESKFKKAFKAVVGTSPYNYHLQLKMAMAKSMLQESDIAVKEVAMALKYTHLGNFTKQFKAFHGFLPSDIIKS